MALNKRKQGKLCSSAIKPGQGFEQPIAKNLLSSFSRFFKIHCNIIFSCYHFFFSCVSSHNKKYKKFQYLFKFLAQIKTFNNFQFCLLLKKTLNNSQNFLPRRKVFTTKKILYVYWKKKKSKNARSDYKERRKYRDAGIRLEVCGVPPEMAVYVRSLPFRENSFVTPSQYFGRHQMTLSLEDIEIPEKLLICMCFLFI